MAVQDPISTSQGRTGTATQAAPPTVQAGPQTLEMPPRFRQSIGPESLWPRASQRVGAGPVLALTEPPGEVLLSERGKRGVYALSENLASPLGNGVRVGQAKATTRQPLRPGDQVWAGLQAPMQAGDSPASLRPPGTPARPVSQF